jgi:choline/glycine/proline betaine transport protein
MLERRPRWAAALSLPVFVPSVLFAGLIVVGTLVDPVRAGAFFSRNLAYITQTFGWFTMLAVASFLVFVVAIASSRWGSFRLGPDHSAPEYSFGSWFAMLFSAGYGIALLFFGVAEPVLHYANPPVGEPETLQAAKHAMQIAFFHWGFHIWAIYGLVGVTLAYFSFRHGLPLSIRSALYPLVGNAIYGPLGHLIDVMAILGTLFGVATTLGLSVTQINAGLHYLFPSVPFAPEVQLACIAIITMLTLVSVVAGLEKGIKRLSIVNIVLAGGLMLFVFLVGPTIHILEAFLENTGSYLNRIVERTFNLEAYERTGWIGNWTLFIFAWTISWAPFVGLFIARISRGRTIREFVFGVLLVPTVVTFLWFSVFGDTALHLILTEGSDELIREVEANHAIALFKLFEQLPLTKLVTGLTLLLITTFFVTSADSGALVVDGLASGGREQTPALQRAFWATMAGLLAAGLLLAGGLEALQAMTVTSALPFSVIMLFAAAGLFRALTIEGRRAASLRDEGHRLDPSAPSAWRKRLTRLVEFPHAAEAERYVEEAAAGAMGELAEALEERGYQAEVQAERDPARARLRVRRGGDLDFIYELRLRLGPRPPFARLGPEDDEVARVEVFLRRGGQGYDVYGYDERELIADILDQLERYLHFRHASTESLPWDIAERDFPEGPEERLPE